MSIAVPTIIVKTMIAAIRTLSSDASELPPLRGEQDGHQIAEGAVRPLMKAA